MIFLKKLSSKEGVFDPIVFKQGINIIQGVSKKGIQDNDANGVGKSSIIRLVDFCLGANNTFFTEAKYDFLKKDTIILELEVNNTSYIIKRNFNNKFFIKETEQSEEELSLDEAKRVLFQKFFPSKENISLPQNCFRDLIKFFIKDDITKMGQNKPYKFSPQGRHTDLYWFNLNLYLMGIENGLYIAYDENEEKLKSYDKEIKGHKNLLKEQYNKTYADLDEEISTIEKTIDKLNDALEKYDYTSFEQIEQDLIKIGGNLKKLYKEQREIERDIENLRESLNYDTNIDINKIKKQYKEIKAVFAEIVGKELENIINFNQRILESRKLFLKEFLEKLTSQKEHTLKNIKDLESKRADLININLNDKDTKFIKERTQYLVKQLAEKSDIKAKLSLIQESQDKKFKFEKNKISIREKISQEATNRIEKIRKIKSIFESNFSLLLSNIAEASFTVRSDVHSKKILEIVFKIPQKDSKGNYAYSFLLYDISLFFNLIKENYQLPKFLFHDGLFGEGIFTERVIRFINKIDEELQHNQFQYIITLNEDNIREEDKKHFSFNFDEQIIVKLKQDNRFFKRNF